MQLAMQIASHDHALLDAIVDTQNLLDHIRHSIYLVWLSLVFRVFSISLEYSTTYIIHVLYHSINIIHTIVI